MGKWTSTSSAVPFGVSSGNDEGVATARRARRMLLIGPAYWLSVQYLAPPEAARETRFALTKEFRRKIEPERTSAAP